MIPFIVLPSVFLLIYVLPAISAWRLTRWLHNSSERYVPDGDDVILTLFPGLNIFHALTLWRMKREIKSSAGIAEKFFGLNKSKGSD